jgi:hypothetical protein
MASTKESSEDHAEFITEFLKRKEGAYPEHLEEMAKSFEEQEEHTPEMLKKLDAVIKACKKKTPEDPVILNLYTASKALGIGKLKNGVVKVPTKKKKPSSATAGPKSAGKQSRQDRVFRNVGPHTKKMTNEELDMFINEISLYVSNQKSQAAGPAVT